MGEKANVKIIYNLKNNLCLFCDTYDTYNEAWSKVFTAKSTHHKTIYNQIIDNEQKK